MVLEMSPSKKFRGESDSVESSKSIDHTSSKEPKEEKVQKVKELIYDPAHFIRCHGSGKRNKSPFDIKTQIWDVSFEPDSSDPQKTTNKIATCG